MSKDFNLDNINKYIQNRQEYSDKHKYNYKNSEFNMNAIFSLFDKNFDGKISKSELRQVSKSEYNNYVEQLKAYNTKNGNSAKNTSIWSYEQIESYMGDAFFTSEEADPNYVAPEAHEGARNLDEKHDLKDITQMSEQEMAEELESYGIDTTNMQKQQLKMTLQSARTERITHDKGSDEVDGHIGTYSQGQSFYCTVLAQIDSMSDEDVSKMYDKTPKTDANGKKYWEVRFPCDEGTDRVIIITEEELNDRTITVEENGQSREIADFPEGDMDVMLLTMAYVKRFGTDITYNGEWGFRTSNRFKSPNEPQVVDNQHAERFTEDDFKNLPPHTQMALLSKDELTAKGVLTGNENKDVSWIKNPIDRMFLGEIYSSFELSDGRKCCISNSGIYLSDGTKIVSYHALAIRRYDETTKELVVTQNNHDNISEVRIPIELAQFLEIATPADAPGAQETRQPAEDE